jgi:hypothetical protein
MRRRRCNIRAERRIGMPIGARRRRSSSAPEWISRTAVGNVREMTRYGATYLGALLFSSRRSASVRAILIHCVAPRYSGQIVSKRRSSSWQVTSFCVRNACRYSFYTQSRPFGFPPSRIIQVKDLKGLNQKVRHKRGRPNRGRRHRGRVSFWAIPEIPPIEPVLANRWSSISTVGSPISPPARFRKPLWPNVLPVSREKGDGGFLYHPPITLAATRMTALTLARTGCPGIRAMITAIVLTASGHAFPLFDFAAAAGMSALFVCHCHDLLP